MFFSFDKTLNLATGRYWWILSVRSSKDSVLTARISCVVRRHGSARCSVASSFSGSLVECRVFQVKNGGSADGVILVDEATPVKVVSEAVDSNADFPGYKPENIDRVDSLVGTFSVAALANSVESLSRDVEGAGFMVLSHIPAALIYSELLRVEGDASCIFTRFENGFSELWLFLDGNLSVYYKIAGDVVERLSSYVQKQFLLNDVTKELCSVDEDSLAKAAAEDAWLFHTDNLPAFHTPADRRALGRIGEAAFFRRTLKVCLAVMFVSLAVLFAFEIASGMYARRSECQIRSFESKIQKQKELELVWAKLEDDKKNSESFLRHRSRMSTSISDLAPLVGENVWINHWGISKKNHSIQGYALSSDDLSEFLSVLENERKLINVRLRTTEKTTWKNRPVVKFDLTAEVIQ